jgi:ubiquinone/menaquinone biosynthesis C-methylase UbiE
MLIRLLKYFCDARLVWDVMGQIYNRRIYDAIAELYDHIAREMRTTSEARILDVGAGRGYMSLLLAAQNPRATILGIDYSPMQVRAADGLKRQRKIDNCRFSRGNAMQMAFEENTFDAVVSVGSIKHWPDGLRGVKEIYRVLKPGGLFVMSETDQEASDKALGQFVGRFQIWFIGDALLFWGLRHVIFGQSYTRQGLESLVYAAGFQNIVGEQVASCPYTIVKAQKP